MREWSAARVAQAAGARLITEASLKPTSVTATEDQGPSRAVIDSRSVGPGDLFIGLRGERADGGEYGSQALAAGAWGVLVADEHAERLLASAREEGGGAVLAHSDPLRGLQALARAWQRELRGRGAKVVAVTGSTGKTSTKDILAALLGNHMRAVASSENLNTEIGLPISLLAAPGDSEVLVLEMAMRGAGQIAELTEIAEPDVGVIVNVGPVHLELLGSLEAIAAAKGELILGMASGATAVVPAREPLLERYRRADLHTVTFGDGGDVTLAERRPDGEVVIALGGERLRIRPDFAQTHNLSNLLAAVAVARALGLTPGGNLEVRFSALRGERIVLAGGITLVNDCYNANPMSMRAAIDDLTETALGRRVAVLGDMLELGAQNGAALHRDVAEYARRGGVDLLVTVGPLAGEMAEAFGGEAHSVADAQAAGELLPGLLREGDTVLVKGSRGVGLELVAQVLQGAPAAGRR